MSGSPLQDIIKNQGAFRRVATDTLDATSQYTFDGRSYDWWWRIRALANGTRSFARFTVPTGYHMALDNRIFLTNSTEGYYRVYRSDVVNVAGLVVGADLPAKSNLRADAGINFTGFANAVTLPTPPNIDDAFIEIPIFNTAGTGGSDPGEFNAENAFRLLPSGAVFYLELNNATGGGGSAYMKARLVFAFIPDSLVPSLPA